MVKKLFAAILCLLLVGCGPQTTSTSHKIKVVTTTFPSYDALRAIIGNDSDYDLHMLLKPGADAHSYEPSPEDIIKVENADMFVYTGGDSDTWVNEILTDKKHGKVIKLMDLVEKREEEEAEGMEEEKDEHHHHDDEEEHDHDHEGDEEEEEEYDEHVWLSLKNAQLFVSAIADSLSQADIAHADAYAANAVAYNKQLAQLDAAYQSAVDAAPIKTVLFADRFPFRYLVDDYGLSYYAAFSGCSADTQASFDTIIFLADKVNELGLHSILTIENSDDKIANTIIQNTQSRDQQVRTLNSMQTVTSNDLASGTTYLSIMKENLSVLSAALQ